MSDDAVLRSPDVSVVIPVRNEAGAIGEAIRSALGQSDAPPLEVIVADGASEDGTRSVVSDMAHVNG